MQVISLCKQSQYHGGQWNAYEIRSVCTHNTCPQTDIWLMSYIYLTLLKGHILRVQVPNWTQNFVLYLGQFRLLGFAYEKHQKCDQGPWCDIVFVILK